MHSKLQIQQFNPTALLQKQSTKVHYSTTENIHKARFFQHYNVILEEKKKLKLD